MKKIIFIIITILCASIFSEILRYVPNSSFGPKEEFKFKVNYGFIPGGFAKLEILDTVRVRGYLCHKIRSVAHSNKALSIVFPVRDTSISFIDVNGLFSLKILKYIREGRYNVCILLLQNS